MNETEHHYSGVDHARRGETNIAFSGPQVVYSQPTPSISPSPYARRVPVDAKSTAQCGHSTEKRRLDTSDEGQTAAKRLRTEVKNKAPAGIPVESFRTHTAALPTAYYRIPAAAGPRVPLRAPPLSRVTCMHQAPHFRHASESTPDPVQQKIAKVHRFNDARDSDKDAIICLWKGEGAREPCFHSCKDTDALLIHCTTMHGVSSAKDNKEKTNCRWVGCSSVNISKGGLKRHLAESQLHGRRARL